MILRQSTSKVRRFGPFVDSTDGVTPETALTITLADMQLSKDGAAFAQKNAVGNATHDVDGYYFATFDVADSNGVGELILQVNVSGALPVRMRWYVVEEAIYDAFYASGADGTLPATISGNVTINVEQVKEGVIDAQAPAFTHISAVSFILGSASDLPFAIEFRNSDSAYGWDESNTAFGSLAADGTWTSGGAVEMGTPSLALDSGSGTTLNDIILELTIAAPSVGKFYVAIPSGYNGSDQLVTADGRLFYGIAPGTGIESMGPSVTEMLLTALVVTAIPELAGDPGATPTLSQAQMLNYMAIRNEMDINKTTGDRSIKNDAGAAILEQDVTDDGTTTTISKVRAPD